ncbi:RNA methyltransferase, TrmH family [Micrococcales bacterium KH10]|nr:RNA methyltransferase, TrmH family [Micrococcales bacterium KH10]
MNMTDRRPPVHPGTSILANPRSDRIKAIRALGGRSARRKTGRYLVEGPQAVREAISFAVDHVVELYVTPQAAARHVEIIGDARQHDVRIAQASPEVVEHISSDAQGILAVMSADSVCVADMTSTNPRVVALLANARDPGNAGTVIRAADACGADGVILAGDSVELYNPKLIRSTVGSLFHLPVVASDGARDLGAVIAELRNHGMMICAADGRGEFDLDDLLDIAGHDEASQPDLARETVWLFGNEAWGLTDADRGLADWTVRIPLRGHAESLNLAMAATICLYASARAQR